MSVISVEKNLNDGEPCSLHWCSGLVPLLLPFCCLAKVFCKKKKKQIFYRFDFIDTFSFCFHLWFLILDACVGTYKREQISLNFCVQAFFYSFRIMLPFTCDSVKCLYLNIRRKKKSEILIQTLSLKEFGNFHIGFG